MWTSGLCNIYNQCLRHYLLHISFSSPTWTLSGIWFSGHYHVLHWPCVCTLGLNVTTQHDLCNTAERCLLPSNIGALVEKALDVQSKSRGDRFWGGPLIVWQSHKSRHDNIECCELFEGVWLAKYKERCADWCLHSLVPRWRKMTWYSLFVRVRPFRKNSGNSCTSGNCQ